MTLAMYIFVMNSLEAKPTINILCKEIDVEDGQL